MGKRQEPIRLLLTGGGTGGHLFPAIATAEAMCRRFPGTEILFVGTRRKMDKSSLAHYGFSTRTIHCQGLKGKGALALLQALILLPLSLVEALWHILRFHPHLVVGVGGYVTGPVVAAAKILGLPTVIHEQNSVPGLANRKLGGLATRICLSLPGSENFFPAGKMVLTGNPVRRQILELAGKSQAKDVPVSLAPRMDEERPPRKNGDKVRILILGGSLGAHRVNELMVDALTKYDKILPPGIEVIHQTGVADQEMVRLAYEQAGIKATVAAFFTDMAEIYGKSDLLVSRAGATTLAELAVLGKPALLIPYPFAADDHQYKNGRYYVDSGGAVMFVERELTGRKLAEALAVLVSNPGRLQEMAEAMQSMARPDAAERIVDVCLELITN
ncbi:MAG: undecaprenyldiphospho-muramoylpentapeptide beta-N-acetylglucosaminyltransferase [Proteobacteria bacterium]|nr:undecaprenyldiphospho-muramoylpentapeptide beta-N-acetylglucosaminyltransferase [Desulfocapsa sp.]MBU3944777.1 undecaprenyldiphospho-muramoylpentapeptide beta-N-acetylglucosaminyltransferase [Pseudomonadota bacterium]MCG2744247.1 undecaprenyldiphospho-muramoylpentapeptide beta-N-acetylglucosaminyltransferase [Desulfobacteraceae bacterium]MBU4029043.1 undecaprenyldiphospho-muramoylpentapeptide beta-N-acetylglucosaminyltransferase [Pseudomonadota bacterium]MBU4042020.1 undecaprenyldiphospho-mu